MCSDYLVTIKKSYWKSLEKKKEEEEEEEEGEEEKETGFDQLPTAHRIHLNFSSR